MEGLPRSRLYQFEEVKYTPPDKHAVHVYNDESRHVLKFVPVKKTRSPAAGRGKMRPLITHRSSRTLVEGLDPLVAEELQAGDNFQQNLQQNLLAAQAEHLAIDHAEAVEMLDDEFLGHDLPPFVDEASESESDDSSSSEDEEEEESDMENEDNPVDPPNINIQGLHAMLQQATNDAPAQPANQGVFRRLFNRMLSRLESVPNAPIPEFDNINQNTIPEPMTGHRCVTDGEFLYVFGGYDHHQFPCGIWYENGLSTMRQASEDLMNHDGNTRTIDAYSAAYGSTVSKFHVCYHTPWRMHLQTGKWQKLPKPKDDLGSASGTAILLNTNNPRDNHTNHGLYVGGTVYPWQKANASISQFTLPKATASKKLSSKDGFRFQEIGSLPIRVYGHAMAFDDDLDQLYIFGGICRDVESDNSMISQVDWSNLFHRVDLETMQVERISAKPSPTTGYGTVPEERLRGEMVYYRNPETGSRRVFLLGGNSTSVTFELSKLNYFDIDNHYWVHDEETIADHSVDGMPEHPRPRCRFSHVLYKKRYLIVCGGEDLGAREIDRSSPRFSDCWSLDLQTLQWQFLAHMPVRMSFHSAAITHEGCMYVFGGKVIDERNVEENTVSVRTNKTYRIWIDVPKLSTLANDALSSTNGG